MLITTFGSAALALRKGWTTSKQNYQAAINSQWVNWIHLGQSGTIRDHQDPSGSIRDLFNPFYVCSLRPVTTSMKPVHLVAAISVDSTAPLIRTGGMLSGQSEAQSDKHQYTSSTNPQSIDNILSSTIINWQKSIIIHSSWTHSRSQLDETCTNLVLVGELRSFEPIICCMWPVAQQDFVTGCERCVATKIVTLSDTTPGKCNVLQDTNTALLWLEVEELIQAKGCQGHPGSIRQQSLYGTPCCLALPCTGEQENPGRWKEDSPNLRRFCDFECLKTILRAFAF